MSDIDWNSAAWAKFKADVAKVPREHVRDVLIALLGIASGLTTRREGLLDACCMLEAASGIGLDGDVTRARPGWKQHGEPDCSDCCTMSHCVVHHKVDGTYPAVIGDEPA